MKKILLATTMIVAGASMAAADVTLSGDARMGIVDNFTGDVALDTRARVSFSLAGETDSGLSFGASFRADNAAGAAAGTAGSVFVSGAFGKLSMGDVDGAANALVGHVSGVGYTGLGDLNESTFIGGGTKESALYQYTTGAFTVALSSGQVSAANVAYSVAAKYATDAFSVALGYEDNDNGTTHTILGASATFSGITVKANYGKASGTIDGTQYAVSAGYTMDAISLTAFYTDDSEVGGAKAAGIGATYDLGGGAKVSAGYVENQTTNVDGFDLGVTFAF